jgi:hypothetical protein
MEPLSKDGVFCKKEVSKNFFFEKKKQKTFIRFRPQALKPAQSKLQKFFCFFFVHKKEDSSFLLDHNNQ